MAALMLAGCMPHVTHGPRVEDDGLSGALSVDLYGNREVGIVAGGILPNVYGALRGSWVPPDGHGVAGSLGVQVPLLLIPFLGDDGFGGFR
ncbi:MAG TPA: hypothetical protein VMM12_13860, partial [Longimicrobiales bacterium]|nr:hypothetical protein [Longimicrobiales bacterium]